MNNHSGDSQVYSRFSCLYAWRELGMQKFVSIDDARKSAGLYVLKIIEFIFVDGRVVDAVLHDARNPEAERVG